MLEFRRSSPGVDGCSAALLTELRSVLSPACGNFPIIVAPGVARSFVFYLRAKSDGLLLQQVSICADRTSEPPLERFVYNPEAEEF